MSKESLDIRVDPICVRATDPDTALASAEPLQHPGPRLQLMSLVSVWAQQPHSLWAARKSQMEAQILGFSVFFSGNIDHWHQQSLKLQ